MRIVTAYRPDSAEWQDDLKTRRPKECGVQTDLGEATVVTLYLSADLNGRLRPKLLAELKPGSRIVSHDFDMGDWQPERVLRVRDDGREQVLYLWTVPARP